MKLFKIILATIFIALTLSSQSQVSWKVDNTHGHMGFSIKYMMLSDYEGRFKIYDGKVQSKSETNFTDAVFNILIDINSVSAVVEGHEDMLKAEDFFDVKNFPIATFRSTSMKPTLAEGLYDLEGNICIRGITKKIKLKAVAATQPVTNPYFNNSNYALKITGTLKRSDFGIGKYDLMDFGGLVLSDEVQINSSLVLIKSDHLIPMAGNFKHVVDEKKLSSYVGQYDYGNGVLLSISKEQNKLFIKKSGGYKKEIFPVTNNKFIYEFYEVEVDFVANGNDVEKLVIVAGKQKTDAQKISDKPESGIMEQSVRDSSKQQNYLNGSWDALMRKSYPEAIEYCLGGLELSPDDLSLKINLAHAYLFSGQQTKAIGYYKENLRKKHYGTIPFSRLIQEDFMFFKSRQYPSEVLDKVFKDLDLAPVEAYKAINLNGG